MRGAGSGNWYRFDRKRTVEESLTLEMRDFNNRLYTRSVGKFIWIWPAGHRSVWSLELLLFLRNNADRAWPREERSSSV